MEKKTGGPIRILHVLGVLNMGGAESRIMDLYRHIDRSKVQFDFLVHTALREEAAPGKREAAGRMSEKEANEPWRSENLMRVRPEEYFDREVRALGGRIYALPRFNGRNFFLYKKAAEAFFASHGGWTAVEGHMTSTASVYLPIAQKSGVPVTVSHVRSAGVDAGLRGVATRLLRAFLPRRADYLLACSKEAGVAAYGRRAAADGRVTVVPNALEITAYRFDAAARRAARERLGLPEEAFVLGHVGRFDAMKNHVFLVELLEKLCAGAKIVERPTATEQETDTVLQNVGKEAASEQATDAAPQSDGAPRSAAGTGKEKRDFRLLLIGQGKLEPEIRARLAAAGLAERAIFAGQCSRQETARLYQAMDCFVFPSFYEGVPGTVVEAQAAGLPCLLSDRITDEVCVSELTQRLPLGDAALWAGKVEEARRELYAGRPAAETAQRAPASVQEEPEEARRAPASAQTGPKTAASVSAPDAETLRAERSAQGLRALRAAGFDIEAQARRLQSWYLELAEKGTAARL